MARAVTGRTAPLDPHGALVLGGEQDCYGGCVDPEQGLYGVLDEASGSCATDGETTPHELKMPLLPGLILLAS